MLAAILIAMSISAADPPLVGGVWKDYARFNTAIVLIDEHHPKPVRWAVGDANMEIKASFKTTPIVILRWPWDDPTEAEVEESLRILSRCRRIKLIEPDAVLGFID